MKCKHKAEKCVTVEHHKACIAMYKTKFLLLAKQAKVLVGERDNKIPVNDWVIVFGRKEASAMKKILKLLKADK